MNNPLKAYKDLLNQQHLLLLYSPAVVSECQHDPIQKQNQIGLVDGAEDPFHLKGTVREK